MQDGWETESIGNRDGNSTETFTRRKLLITVDSNETKSHGMRSHRSLQSLNIAELGQRLVNGLPGCDISWYNNSTELLGKEHLWPIWKTEEPSTSLLSPSMLRDMCVAEQNTQRVLEANNFCFGCQEGCLPPYSPVLYARILVENGFALDCQQLSEQWATYQANTESLWSQCAADLKIVYDAKNDWKMPASCPPGFTAALVQQDFDTTKFLTYTSSIFATNVTAKTMYDLAENFDQGTDAVYGAYDTQKGGFM